MEKKTRKCTWCGKIATQQTVRGKDNERIGGLSINDGWFCSKCYEKGLKAEQEAMYG